MNERSHARGANVSHVATPAGFPYPWYMRLIFWRQRRRYGRELEPVRLWGRIPGAFPAMSALYRTVDRKAGRLDAPLRSLVQVLVSQLLRREAAVETQRRVEVVTELAAVDLRD
ncbi:MAG: hypothetical protein ACT4P8_22060, partial [Betaproteobacteria bacterium]